MTRTVIILGTGEPIETRPDFCVMLLTDLPLDVKLCQSPTGEEEVRSAFDQLVSVLLCDLIALAVPVFEKVSSVHQKVLERVMEEKKRRVTGVERERERERESMQLNSILYF